MRAHGLSGSALLSLFVLMASATAFAQSQPTAPTTTAAAQAAPADSEQRPVPAPTPVTIERVPSGWVVAPDVTFTEVNKQAATLVGAYGGWLQDRMWMFGGGVYWMANQGHDDMVYGGLVTQFMSRSDRRIGFGVKGLIGGGDASITARYGDVFGTPVASGPPIVFGGGHHHPPHPDNRPPSGGITADTRLVFNEVFFIAEPQAQLMWNVSDHVRITFGAGYRITAGGNEVNDRLRGPIGSLSVEFGGGH